MIFVFRQRLVCLVLLVGCGRLEFRSHPDAHAFTVYMSNSLATGVDLCTLDVTTGQVQVLGTLPPALGELGGLAWWGANELYAGNRTGDIVEVTLSPLAGAVVQNEGGHIGGLERVGDALVGIDQIAHDVISLQPPGGTITHIPLTSGGSSLATSGGDLVEMSNGDVLLWPNVGGQLFRLDPATGVATPLGPVVTGAVSIQGLVRDDQDHLYGVAAATEQVVDIDAATGAIGAGRTLCVDCPTPYNFVSGDLTRSL